MHKLSSRLLVLSCACFILFSVLSFSVFADTEFSYFSSNKIMTISEGRAGTSIKTGDQLTLTFLNVLSPGVYTIECEVSPYVYYYDSTDTRISLSISSDGNFRTFTLPVSTTRLDISTTNSSYKTVFIPLPFGDAPLVPETAPPEYGDMLGMMTSGFSTVSGIWQGVIDLVASNWLLVVGLVCFIAVFAISSFRRHYRS